MTFAIAADRESDLKCFETHLKTHLIVQNIDVTNFLFFGTTEQAEKAVLEGQAVASVHFLSALPTVRSEGLRIGAVLPRMEAGYTLCIWKKYADTTKSMQLPDAAEISVSNEFEAAQVLDFRNDFIFRYENVQRFVTKEQKRAFLMPNFMLSQINTENYILIPLDKSELVPPPAHGVLALQYNKYDTDTEVLLRSFHSKKTLLYCNIEREAQQIIGDERAKNRLGVYCESDENGNYHAFCVWSDIEKKRLEFFKISQNARHNLAKNIIKKIENFE
jgi:hydroxymethylbilane synthase